MAVRKRPPGGNRPPQSERSGRGALIDPFDKDYQRIGRSNRYRNPERSMTVGVRTRKDYGSDEANYQRKQGVSSMRRRRRRPGPPGVPYAPKSDRAPNYAQGPSHAQRRDPKAMLARGLGASYKGSKQGPPGHLVGRGAVRHSPDGSSSWSGPPDEQRRARRSENRRNTPTSAPRSETAPKRARGASWGIGGGESATGPMRSSKGGWVVPSHMKGTTIRLSENHYSAPRKNRGPKSEQRFNLKRAASNRLKRG